MSETLSSKLALERTPRQKLTQTVAQQLLEQMRGQHLQPGARMPSERELMTALGVGRSTVREALNGLALLGVLEIRHGQGAFVARVPHHDAHEELAAALAKGVTQDLLEARRVIEVAVARLAAERRTRTDLRSMKTALDQHERCLDAEITSAEPSANFHLEIAEAAHNEVLAATVASFMPLLQELGPSLEELPDYRDWELTEHRALYDAIRSGDPDVAGERMLAHLDAMVAHHERLLRSP